MTGNTGAVDNPEPLIGQVKDIIFIQKAMASQCVRMNRKNGGRVGMLEFILWSESQVVD